MTAARYNDHEWDSFKFENVRRWADKEEVTKFIKKLEQEYNIKKLDDWYNIPWKVVYNDGGRVCD